MSRTTKTGAGLSWFRVFVCKDTKPHYIADGTKFTDHSELSDYTGLQYYVLKTYYERVGTKE